MDNEKLLEALAVTTELCGKSFSEAAIKIFIQDLSIYPEDQVLKSLARCRREVRGGLTLHDVVCRIDDGRPGAEEAWAMIPVYESESVVWTDEMAEAYGIAQKLVASDAVAARMAFKETYTKLVSAARDAGKPVNWTPSLGHDPRGREAAIADAVERGRIKYEHGAELVPSLPGKNKLLIENKEAKAAIAKAVVRALKPPIADNDPKAWAWRLRTREMACENLTKAQRDMWRAALHYEILAFEEKAALGQN